MKFSIHAFAVMGVIFCSGYSWAAIQGKYYIISGDQRSIDVLQGNGVVQSWAADNRGEYPIAVLDGTVRTSESFFLRCGVYDRRHPGVIQQFYDGTTGGTHNYGYDYSAGRMYQMDLGRQNPVTLFAGPSFNLGVTYDPSNNSLWVSSWSGTQIANFDMSGNLLSSFTTGVSSVTGLALDHTDGTLWFGTQSNLSSSNRTFYQYSKQGLLLDTESVAGLQGINYLGGEFELLTSIQVVPEPATLFVWSGLGLAVAGSYYAKKKWALSQV